VSSWHAVGANDYGDRLEATSGADVDREGFDEDSLFHDAAEDTGRSGLVDLIDVGVCRLIEQEGYVGALKYAGSNSLARIAEWLDEGLPGVDLEELLQVVWLESDISDEFDTDDVVSLFRQAGFVTDSRWVAAPEDVMTVYRGCTPEGIARPSWSMNRGVACWYRGGDSRVYVARIAPDDELAIYLSRCSREVVVDPRGLRDVREVGRPRVVFIPSDDYDEFRELRAIGMQPSPIVRRDALSSRLRVRR
jgi:hypothetical protein